MFQILKTIQKLLIAVHFVIFGEIQPKLFKLKNGNALKSLDRKMTRFNMDCNISSDTQRMHSNCSSFSPILRYHCTPKKREF